MDLVKENIRQLLGEKKYEDVSRKFREYLAIKATLESKIEQLKSTPVDLWPYSSPLNPDLGTSIKGGNRGDGPQVGVTIAIEKIGDDLSELYKKMVHLEEALYAAIDSAAVNHAGHGKMAKIRKALENYLIYQMPKSQAAEGITVKTLEKYSDLAIYYAAKNLDYLDEIEKHQSHPNKRKFRFKIGR